MKWKHPVDLPEDIPVPERVHLKVAKILRGARAIDIRGEANPGKYLQVNRIDLTLKSPKEPPAEAPPDIAEAVCVAMHAHWIDKFGEEENPEPIKFKIVAILHKDCARTTAEFQYVWDPAETIDNRYAEDGDPFRDEMLESYRIREERSLAYIEELHAVVLRQASMNAEPIAASSEMAKWAGGLAVQSMNAMLSASKLTYDHEAARAKEEQETLRSDKRWERLGGLLELGVKKAATELGKYMGEKAKARAERLGREFGIDIDMDGDADGEDSPESAGEDREPDPSAQAPSDSSRPSGPSEDELDARARSHPISTLCQMFGESMTAKQHKFLSELAPEHVPLFHELFCVEDEDEAVEIWQQLSDRLSIEQLLRLAEQLDPEQQAIYAKVGELVEARSDQD